MAVSTALPPGDKELPLSEHLRELRNRIAIVIGVTIVLMFIAFPFSESMISVIWGHVMPAYVNMTVYEPLEILKVRITISFIFAIAVGFPLLVYEGFRFAAPGLFQPE
jgi:sec-independent protein translocase protein TatC